MKGFKLTSNYKPTGDQPEAIKQLTEGILNGEKSQVLLGVTGSGKTFTVANVIANVNKPTLILSHNKTLAAQLYSEMKSFSLIMRWSIMYHTMIIISLKHIYHRRIHILKKILLLMRR